MIVPKWFQLAIPRGFGYAAALRQFPLTPDHAAPVIHAGLWTRAVSQTIAAVVLVASLPVRVLAQGPHTWPDCLDLSPRVQWAWRADEGTTLSVSAMQHRWPGEVLAVPLKIVDANTADLLRLNEHRLNLTAAPG